VLEALASSNIEVKAVLLQRSRPLGRLVRLVRALGAVATLSIVVRRLKTELTVSSSQNSRRADAYRLHARQVFRVRDLSSPEAVATLERLSPDIGVVGCAGILRPEVFGAFRLGVLNIHPGITPDFRGRSPMEWAILEEASLGVTLHFIDEGVDTGPVVRQREVSVQRGDDFRTLYDRAYAVGIELLVGSLRKLQEGGSLSSTSQNWKRTRLRYSMARGLRRRAHRMLRERTLSEEG